MSSEDLDGWIEWAERVVAISDEQGQPCHQYEGAARAILALARYRTRANGWRPSDGYEP